MGSFYDLRTSQRPRRGLDSSPQYRAGRARRNPNNPSRPSGPHPGASNMKRIIVGVALVGLAFGCRSDKNTSVSDPSAANMPKAECCKGDSSKCEGDKAACEG